MPDYDLGKAHGKVVIDSDHRGADKSDRALDSLNRTALKLEAVLKKLERTVDKFERELDSVAKRARKAEDALDDLDDSFVSVDKHSRRSSKSVRNFDGDLQSVIATAMKLKRAFDTLWPPIDHVWSSIRAFNDADSLRGYMRAINYTTMFTKGMKALGGQIIGVNKAYASLNDRQSRFVKNAAKLSAVVAGLSVADKLVPAFGKLLGRMNSVQSAGNRLRNTLSVINNYAINGEGNIQRYAQRFMTLAYRMDDTGNSANNLYRNLRRLVGSLDQVGRGSVQALIGLKIFQQGMDGVRRSFGGLSLKGLDSDVKLVMAGIVAAISVLGPMSEIAAKGLVVLSNAFNLLWNAVTQLSGGLLTLPGLYGTIAAGIVPLVVALKGLSDKFKGITGTASEFWEAMEKMPKHLRPVAIELRKLHRDFTELQKALQTKLLVGIERDFEDFRTNYAPAIRRAFSGVVGAYNAARTEFSNFLFSTDTITDFNRAFMAVEGTIRNLARAIEPFSNAMRDITVVGMQFFRDWSSGSQGLAKRFEEWAASARKTGELRKYMDDALEGAKNLVRGMDDLVRATWKLLTLFATDSGDNALERFADSMQRFNDAVDRSKANGFLKEFSDRVKNLGFGKFNELKSYLEGFKVPIEELLDALIPFIQGISAAFKDIFTPMVKVATQILESFLEAFSGLEPAIGWILGIAAGFKLVAAVSGPILAAGKAVIGLVVAVKGLKAALLGSQAAMTAFGFLFDKIIPGPSRIAAFDRLNSTIERTKAAMTRLAVPAGAVIGTIAAVALGIIEARSDISRFNETVQESKRVFGEWKDGLHEAFGEDSGLVGKTVFDQVSNGMGNMLTELENQASHVPGFMDNLEALWFGTGDEFGAGIGPFSWNQGSEFNAMQKAAQDAERAKKKFDELGLSSQDLAAIVTGSQAGFDEFSNSVLGTGENANEARAAIQQYRNEFVAMRDEFEAIGPGAVNVSEGIALIADAGGDATTKLQGLKQALQGLGLDKSTEIENAFAYAEAIRAIGDEAAKAVDSEAGLGDIWNAQGGLNTASVNAQNLFGVLRDAVNNFQQVAIDTGNAQQAFADLEAQLPKLAAAFTPVGGNVADTEAKIRNLVTQLGGVPSVVDILISVQGGDKIKQDLAAILLDLQTTTDSEIKIPLTADREGLQKALDDIFGIGNAAVGEYGVTINRANITPEAEAELQRILGANGIQAPGAPAPSAPATVPVQPVPATGGDKPLVGGAGSGAATGPAPAPPKVAPPPQDTAALDAANNKIKDLENTIKSLNEQKTRIEISTEKIDEVKAKLDEIKAKAEELKTNVEFWIIVKGFDESTAVLNQVKDAVTALITEATKIGTEFTKTFAVALQSAQTFVTQFKGIIDTLATTARAQGDRFVTEFAAGLSENRAAIAAAENMAREIRERFHQSPPKKGPLAAHGDAARYAGGRFVDAYATGMDGNQSAAGAANRMAGGVAGQAAQGPYELGKLLGVLQDFFGFGQKLLDAFTQISDVMFNMAKIIADPLGEGKFFGQKLYGRDRSVSDRQLQRQREDALQARASDLAGQDRGRGGRAGPYTSDADLLANVPKGTYLHTQDADLTEGIADCTSAIEDLVYMMDGRPTGGRSMSTGNAAEWLLENGFVPGTGGLGDFRVAFNAGHMQATLPGGTPFNWGSDAAAARGGIGGTGADDPALTERYYRPVDEAVRRSIQDNADAVGSATESAIKESGRDILGPDLSQLTEQERQQIETGQYSLQTQEDMLRSLREQNGSLNNALGVLENQESTNEQIYGALPELDRAIEEQTKIDTPGSRQNASALESIRGEAMSSRGIVEQDPIGMAQCQCP